MSFLVAIDLVKWVAIEQEKKDWFLKKYIFRVYFHQVYKCVKKCYEEGRCVFKEKFRWQMVSSMRFQLCRCGMYYGMCELKGKLVGIYLRKEYKGIFVYFVLQEKERIMWTRHTSLQW